MDGGDKAGRSSGRQTVLIVEDEEDLVIMLTYNLEREGYTVQSVADGDEAVVAAGEHNPAIIILDWMLPHKSGLDICRQLRRGAKTRDIPVIMLTARGEEADRIRGLDSGADDYISKPFSIVELMARIRAVLRRTGPSSNEDSLEFGDTRMDLVAHRVTRAGRDIHLGPTEFRLLRHFMQYPGRVFSREQLLDVVWGHDVYVEPRTVDVHIRRLRKAINDGDLPDIIRTVRSAGYALDRPKQIDDSDEQGS
ncbi:phosphate regulon transcriptional regulator PhoB [Fodinicurvata sp. EGI_FJ10296]|uniref:phosphate regulon transcriptional regulator PhoB n=1 Tax=Fodinicurvata sp. EGI_FJ10296 TaxID=3231908 RepID=UPI003452EBCA